MILWKCVHWQEYFGSVKCGFTLTIPAEFIRHALRSMSSVPCQCQGKEDLDREIPFCIRWMDKLQGLGGAPNTAAWIQLSEMVHHQDSEILEPVSHLGKRQWSWCSKEGQTTQGLLLFCFTDNSGYSHWVWGIADSTAPTVPALALYPPSPFDFHATGHMENCVPGLFYTSCVQNSLLLMVSTNWRLGHHIHDSRSFSV